MIIKFKIKFFTFFSLLVLSFINVNAIDINELKKNFEKKFKNKDTDFFQDGQKLVEYYQFYIPDSAFYYLDIMSDYAFEKNLIEKQAALFYSLGIIYYYRQQDIDAATFFTYSLQKYFEMNSSRDFANVLIRLSKSLFINNPNNTYSFQYIQQSLEIAKKNKYNDILIKDYNTLSFFYDNIDSTALSMKYLDSALFYSNLEKNYSLITETYWFLATHYEKIGDDENAIEYYKKALSITQNTFNFLNYSLSLSSLYIRINKFTEAYTLLQKSTTIATTSKNNVFLISIYQTFAQLFEKQSKFDKSIEYTQKALILAKKLNLIYYKIESYKILANTYSQLEQYELSVLAYQKYAQLVDTLKKINNIKENKIVNENFQILMRLKNKELIETQQELQKLRNKQQKNMIYFLGIVGILLVLLVVILSNLYISRRKNEQRLKQFAEATLEGLYLHDGDRIIEVNDRILEMTGYTRKELIGQRTTLLLPESSQLIVNQKANMLKPVFYQFKLKRKDGTTFDVDLLSKPFVYKGIKSKVISVRDMSKLHHIKQQLTDTKLQLASLVDTSPDGIIILNLNGSIVYASPAFAKIFNKPNANYFIEKNITDFFIGDYKNKILQDIKNIAKGTYVGTSEYIATKDYLKEFFVECNGNYIKDHKNNIIAIFLIVRDVTDRKIVEKALIESESRFKSLYNNAKDAIIIINSNDFKIADANPFTSKLLKIDADIILKKDFTEFVIPTERDEFILNIRKQEPFETFLRVTQNNKNVNVHITVSETYFDGDLYFLLIIRDFTEIKIQQNKLKRVAEQMQKAIELRDRMFSIISHDLRGPIGNFNSMLQYIIDNSSEFSIDELFQIIDALRHSSAQTYELLENLLSWAKSQQNLLDYHPTIFDINEEINSVIQYAKFQAKSKNISIETNIQNQILVIGDENMIKSTLRNLISNAVKFSFQNNKVKVDITDDNEFWITISIIDTGIGMSEETIDKIFNLNEHFSTLGTNREKGSGLGLQLCKEFIKRNNGNFSVSSAINQGTTISFTLKKA